MGEQALAKPFGMSYSRGIRHWAAHKDDQPNTKWRSSI